MAKKNVETNNINDKIKIIHQTNSKNIFKGIIDGDNNDNDKFDFTVCNPPFFEHLEETGLNKSRSNNATKHELVYEDGGEVGFIKLMIDEIKELRLYNKCNWFTTMLGKKSSIKAIKSILHKQQIVNDDTFIVTTNFYQGKQVRWGLAWTYDINIKNKYNFMYGLSKDKNNKNNNHKKKNEEILFDLIIRNDAIDYNQCLMNKLENLFKKYGIKYNKSLGSMYNESKNAWIEMDDIKNNGFTFSMKWIIKPCKTNITNNDKLCLSIIITFRHHNGDKQLFDGFVSWFHKSAVKLSK